MNILVATNQLDIVGGSETFTYTVIEELKRRKYNVEYFTFEKGAFAHRMEKELGVQFMSRDKYDLIFANHYTCVDKLHKMGFTIQTCHGIYPALEQPSLNAHAHVSISQEVQEHLARNDVSSIIIHNGINLDRFKSTRPINNCLKTVLSLCHSEEANNFIKKACDELEVDFIKAYKYKEPVWNVEEIINQADLVVGLGRSAYEAMACSRPVVIYDNRRYFKSYGDGYIKQFLGLSIKNNCSGRYFKFNFDHERFKEELKKYSPDEGAFLRQFAEQELDIKKNINRYFEYVKNLKENRYLRRKMKQVKIGQRILGVKGFASILWLRRKLGLKKDNSTS